jgi:hypothetical protein
MASKILGRTDCPIRCADPIAHVKIKTDKATEAYPYVHCRGCGCQLHTKNEEQARHLLAITRAQALDAPTAPPVPTPEPAPADDLPSDPPPPAPAARRGLGAWRGV